jgi:hypothetical protein
MPHPHSLSKCAICHCVSHAVSRRWDVIPGTTHCGAHFPNGFDAVTDRGVLLGPEGNRVFVQTLKNPVETVVLGCGGMRSCAVPPDTKVSTCVINAVHSHLSRYNDESIGAPASDFPGAAVTFVGTSAGKYRLPLSCLSAHMWRADLLS